MVKRKPKKEKDKDAPKRATSPFFFFIQERRAKLKKENPEFDNKELIRRISKEWNDMTDDERQIYIEKGDADRKRYEEEKKIYDMKKAKQNA